MGAHFDENSCQVSRGGRIAGLFDALYVQGVPESLLKCECPLRLKLQCVVCAKLDMLRLCQILPPQPNAVTCQGMRLQQQAQTSLHSLHMDRPTSASK